MKLEALINYDPGKQQEHPVTDRPQKTREELALGVIDPKTGKRKGGFIVAQRKMKQNQEAMAAGLLSEDELVEKAFRAADAYIARRDAAGDGDDPFSDDDADYRLEQKERYEELYEWNDANDRAALEQLLDLEVQSRAVNREFSRAHLNVKDRTSLLGELRNIAKDHAALQKALGIDRITRDSRARSEDPMQALREQIKLGADYVRQLREEWPSVAPTVKSMEELVALAQHHSGMPVEWVQATLAAHKRLLAVDGDSTAAVVE